MINYCNRLFIQKHSFTTIIVNRLIFFFIRIKNITTAIAVRVMNLSALIVREDLSKRIKYSRMLYIYKNTSFLETHPE